MEDESTAEWGLAAYGESEDVEVHLLEPEDPENPWVLMIEIGGFCVQLNLDGPELAFELHEFLMRNVGKTSSHPAEEGEDPDLPVGTTIYEEVDELCIQASEDTSLCLTKDGESPKRFAFRVNAPGYDLFLDLDEEQVDPLIEAFGQMKTDWEADDEEEDDDDVDEEDGDLPS